MAAQADFRGNHVNAGGGIYFNTTTTNVNNLSALPSNVFIHPQLLVKACRDGNVPLAKELLNHTKPGDINYADITDDSNTALHLATKSNRIELVEILLESRFIDVNARNTSEETPLLLAARLGLTNIAARLIDKPGINLNAINASGQTALIWATAQGNINLVQALLQRPEIDPNVADKEDKTALFHASRNGREKVVQILLYNAKVDVNQLNSKGMPVLVAEILHASESMESLRRLLSHLYIDVNIPCGLTSALQSHARPNVVQMLLERSDIKGWWTPLVKAISKQTNIVTMLLDHPKINVNLRTGLDGWTALNLAANSGCTEIVSQLLKRADIDPNICDHNGWSPLMRAARNGHADVVRALLKHPNVDPNILNKKGLSPLGVATNRQIEQLLIARGAFKSPKDSDCCIA